MSAEFFQKQMALFPYIRTKFIDKLVDFWKRGARGIAANYDLLEFISCISLPSEVDREYVLSEEDRRYSLQRVDLILSLHRIPEFQRETYLLSLKSIDKLPIQFLIRFSSVFY